MALVLVLGGTRSGKSEVAERIAAAARRARRLRGHGRGERRRRWRERIAAHRARRPASWTTVETARPRGRRSPAPDGATVLVDSLGGWLAALMLARGPAHRRARGRARRRRASGRAPRCSSACAHSPSRPPRVPRSPSWWPRRPGSARWRTGAGDPPLPRPRRRGGAAPRRRARTRVLLVVAGRTPGAGPAQATDESPPRHDAVVPAALRVHGDVLVPPGAEDFAVNVERRPPARVARRRAAPPRSTLPARTPTSARPSRPWPAATAARPRRSSSPTAPPRPSGCSPPPCARPARSAVHPSFTEPEAALRAHGHRVERAFRRPHDFVARPRRRAPRRRPRRARQPEQPHRRAPPRRRCRRARPAGAHARGRRGVHGLRARRGREPGRRGDLPGLVVVRSLTKLWGAGRGAGRLPAAPGERRRRRCVACGRPWNVNALALAAAAGLRRPAARGARRWPSGRGGPRATSTRASRALPGRAHWPSRRRTSCSLRVPDGERVRAGAAGPRDRRPPVRRPSPASGADHLRVTVREPEANLRLVAALEEVLRVRRRRRPRLGGPSA